MGDVGSSLCGCNSVFMGGDATVIADVDLVTSLCSDFKFDVLRCEVPKLCAYYTTMVSSKQCANSANASAYVIAVASKYRDNPYHNFFHAFSVTQWKFAMLERSPALQGTLTQIDTLALFAASIAHDVEHPGNNNAFETATKSELAVRYNDKAVLENHHAAVGLEIMQSDKCNMFSQLNAEQSGQARQVYTHAILMTDMAEHKGMTDRLVARSEAYSRSPADRLELAGVLMHSADVSNPLLPEFDVCRKWAQLITEEFRNQYNKEIELGLPETKMWANVHTPIGFYGSQVGFIDFMILPFWKALLDKYQDLEQNANLLENLERNKETWKKLKAAEEEKK